MGLTGQLDEGNYLVRWSGFPKCGGCVVPELGLESSLSILLSTVPLSLCTTWSGTSLSQGGISILPWNSRVYWSWHIFHRTHDYSWFPYWFADFNRTVKETLSFDCWSHHHHYQNSFGESISSMEHWHCLKSPFFCSILLPDGLLTANGPKLQAKCFIYIIC